MGQVHKDRPEWHRKSRWIRGLLLQPDRSRVIDLRGVAGGTGHFGFRVILFASTFGDDLTVLDSWRRMPIGLANRLGPSLARLIP